MENIQSRPQPESEKDYILLDENNMLNGFYNNKIHSTIPEGCIEITKEIKKYMLGLHQRIKIKDVTQPITEDNIEIIEPEPVERPISETEKLRADVDFLMIMGGYNE